MQVPRKLSVPLRDFPITDQINENWNSQATSYDGILTIEEFNGPDGEDSENRLMEYIQTERMRASKRKDFYTADVLCRILDWMKTIDEYQDSKMERLLRAFRRIKYENRQMNARLLLIDPLKTERYYRKVDRQLTLGMTVERGIRVFKDDGPGGCYSGVSACVGRV